MNGQSEPRAAATPSRAEEGSRREAEAQDNQGNAKTRNTGEQRGEVDSPGKIPCRGGLHGPGKGLAGATFPTPLERATLEPKGSKHRQTTTLEPRLGRHLHGGMPIFVKITYTQVQMRTRRRRSSARSLPRRSTRPPTSALPGTTTAPRQDPCRGPRQDPCRGHQQGHSQARTSQDSTAVPMQLLAQPAGQAPAWRRVASTPTQPAPVW